jgi:glutamine synthetase
MTTDWIKAAQSSGIKYFLVSYTDLFGAQRAKLVPADALSDMVKTGGATFAGFATWLDLSPADADLFARPDPDSLIQLPWKTEVGWLAADLWIDGQELDHGPRNILKRLTEEARDDGFEFKTGVECEFFLLTADGKAIADHADTQEKPCYDAQALMRRYDVITEICDAMQGLGWKPYQNDHEDGNGQFEMNWHYDRALVTADRHVFFKFMARSIAEKHGLRASFMPKPFTNLTGSGCHIHASIWREDHNLFADPAGELGLSTLGYHFIAGVIEQAAALCALTNPTVNSYKRINAPRTISGATWAHPGWRPLRVPSAGRRRQPLSHAGRDARGRVGRHPSSKRSRQAARHQHVHPWPSGEKRQEITAQSLGRAAEFRKIQRAQEPSRRRLRQILLRDAHQ